MRRRRVHSDSQGFTLVYPMIDVMAVSLLVVLAMGPQFGLQGVQLPQITTASGASAQSSASATRRVRLAPEGTVTWDDRPIAVETLAETIRKQTNPNDRVSLVIDAPEPRVQSLLKIINDCDRQKVWERVRVIQRKPAPEHATGAGGS